MSRLGLAAKLFAPIALLSILAWAGIQIRSNSEVRACIGSPSALSFYVLGEVASNQAAYQDVENQTQVPWELLAGIHYRETSFGRTNPSNGQGIFQFVNGEGGPYPAGPVNEAEFRRQLKFMADKLQDDYVWRSSLNYPKRRLKASNEDHYRIKDVLFSYNGRASVYAAQAATYGFNSATEPYEGSPYVMNKADCARINMGIITQDFGSLDGIDTRYGAYTIFRELSGAGTSTNYNDIVQGEDFDAGAVISDLIFFDTEAMSQADIQAFLNNQVQICDANGVQPNEFGSGTRAAFGTSNGYPPPFRCLKDYNENPTTHTNNLNGASTPSGARSAAWIIKDAATSNGINPQVILSVLESARSIVADDWPWNSQYINAMLAPCNGTPAVCAADYDGFYNQVNRGAELLAAYALSGQGNTYEAGDTVSIPYSSSCSGASVSIGDSATAAIYNYFSYQPNQAALDNTYGTGDGCSDYKVRDFWTSFNNWFGASSPGPIVRTTSNATLYALSSNGTKHVLPDLATKTAFGNLSQLSYVRDDLLASVPTGNPVKRQIKGSGSSIYFFDAGIKLGFTSCGQVADFAMTCSDYLQLTDSQIAKFANGPNMRNNYKTTNDKIFRVDDGLRHEATSLDALNAAGYGTSSVQLHETGIKAVPRGVPIVDANGYIEDRETGNRDYLASGQTILKIPNLIEELNAFDALTRFELDQASLDVAAALTPSGYFTSGTDTYLIGENGKVKLDDPSNWSSDITTVTSSLLAVIPSDFTISQTDLIKAPNNGSIYITVNQQKAPIASWSNVLLIDSTPTIRTIPAHYVNQLDSIRTQFGPTRLLKAVGNNTVYIIDGLNKKRPLTSMSRAQAIGAVAKLLLVSQSTLDGYTDSGPTLGFKHNCYGDDYLATQGSAYKVDASAVTAFGFSSFTALDDLTCNNINTNQDLTHRYLKIEGNSSIYYVTGGEKRPFTSYGKYAAHGGTVANTITFQAQMANLVPTGATMP